MEIIGQHRGYWIFKSASGVYRIDGLPGDHPTAQHAREYIDEFEREIIY